MEDEADNTYEHIVIVLQKRDTRKYEDQKPYGPLKLGNFVACVGCLNCCLPDFVRSIDFLVLRTVQSSYFSWLLENLSGGMSGHADGLFGPYVCVCSNLIKQT